MSHKRAKFSFAFKVTNTEIILGSDLIKRDNQRLCKLQHV